MGALLPEMNAVLPKGKSGKTAKYRVLKANMKKIKTFPPASNLGCYS